MVGKMKAMSVVAFSSVSDGSRTIMLFTHYRLPSSVEQPLTTQPFYKKLRNIAILLSGPDNRINKYKKTKKANWDFPVGLSNSGTDQS